MARRLGSRLKNGMFRGDKKRQFPLKLLPKESVICKNEGLQEYSPKKMSSLSHLNSVTALKNGPTVKDQGPILPSLG